MQTSHITLSVADGTNMQAFTVLPDGKPSAGLILFQEAFGVSGHIQGIARKLAAEGFAVIAPELFHRSAPPGWVAPYGQDFSLIMPHFQALTPEGLGADARASYDWLTARGISRVGAIGFCLGGRVAFLANAELPLGAAVSYYGGSLDQIAFMAPRLNGPHLFLWGGLDKHITPHVRSAVLEAVEAAGKPHASIVFSYADHAFNNDERPNYNPDASREGWALSMAFLKGRLQ
jgi:carboxymethylenebutenolidase